MQVAKDKILTRSNLLRLRMIGESIEITHAGRTIKGGKHALKILDVFSSSISLDEAITQLNSAVRGMQDWIDLTAEIHNLYENGVLISVDEQNNLYRPGKGFGAIPIHVIMINDQTRTHAFLSAVRETVQPDDVVLEIGAGVGLLSIAAAGAGAKHVYAIEATGIAQIAREMFKANGVADRITLIEGWSTQIDLPEKVDVLISEIIGNEIFEEKVLESISDAVKRHLKPQARIIPSQIDVLAQPLYIPDDVLKTYSPIASQCAAWQTAYDINFSPLMAASQTQYLRIALKAYKARDWTCIGNPLPMTSIDLSTNKRVVVEGRAKSNVQETTYINAVMIYPDLKLIDTIHLARHISESTRDENWASVFYLLPKALEVKAGEAFVVNYKTGYSHATVSVEPTSSD